MKAKRQLRTLRVRSGRLLIDILLSSASVGAAVVLLLLSARILDASANVHNLIYSIIAYAVAAAIGLSASRTSRMIWQYISFRDMLTLVRAATITVCLFLTLQIFLGRAPTDPIGLASLSLVVWLSNITFLFAPRLIARIIAEAHLRGEPKWQTNGSAIPALITGDVDRIEAFIRECTRRGNPKYRIVGVLTEDGSYDGSYLHGIRVLGSISQLTDVMAHYPANGGLPQILIVARDAAQREIQHIVEDAGSAGLKVGRLPSPDDFQDKTVVHPIELADLLGRPEVTADVGALTSMIRGKSVLITGAGGSIGSELTRQIARLAPCRLTVVDFSEFNLYAIDQELSESHPDVPREAALVDIRDGELVDRLLLRVHPAIVFHAAALKHVPMLESQPIEAVKTNVFGTVNVADACYRHGVETMVTVSTDKAVNPTNIMGATKRLAESYCQGIDQSAGKGRTRFVTVRFGNVLGSAGSVVPLFQRQIEAGGPVTVTHPDITRYFMTIPEAVVLVLQAGAHGMNLDDERGSIYVLEMGRPVKILDLARQMIRLSGHKPDEDIKIKFIGLRPGEKLHEEVIHRGETILPTKVRCIVKIAPRTTDRRIIGQQILELRNGTASNDLERILRLVRLSVPEYIPATDEPIGAHG